MKEHTLRLKKGDLVWVEIYDTHGIPIKMRAAEVLSTLQLPVSVKKVNYVLVRYLDKDNQQYECVLLDHIAGFYELEHSQK